MSGSTPLVEAPAAFVRGSETGRRIVARSRSSRRARSIRICVILAAISFLALCVSVSVGDFPIPLRDVVPAIFGLGDDATGFIVQELRLPRAVTGFLVGVALAGSGAIFQAFARNPLASPDILGVTSGAAVGAVLAITMMGGNFAPTAIGAFVGALAITLAIYALAYKRGVSSYRFILVGIGLGAMAAATTSYLVTRSVIFLAAGATAWLIGTLSARGWETVIPLAIALGVLVPVALLLTHRIGILQLGNDTAQGLGVGVERSQIAVVMVAVGLAGVGVAAGGPVAFVALIAPAVARRLTRSPLALVASMVAGGCLVLIADLIGRRIFAPAEIQVGVITGIIGAPYLLWLLVRANRIGRGG